MGVTRIVDSEESRPRNARPEILVYIYIYIYIYIYVFEMLDMVMCFQKNSCCQKLHLRVTYLEGYVIKVLRMDHMDRLSVR